MSTSFQIKLFFCFFSSGTSSSPIFLCLIISMKKKIDGGKEIINCRFALLTSRQVHFFEFVFSKNLCPTRQHLCVYHSTSGEPLFYIRKKTSINPLNVYIVFFLVQSYFFFVFCFGKLNAMMERSRGAPRMDDFFCFHILHRC